MGVPEQAEPTYRYGEFPELFWDARPNEVIDPENPVVLARVLTQGSEDAVAKLVRPETLERLLPTLVIPEHSRRFWNVVLEHLRRGEQEEETSRAQPSRMVIEASVLPRAGWSDAARRMAEGGEDTLLDPPVRTEFDAEEWTW